MKTVLRYLLINLVALWVTTEIIKGLSYTGGVKTLIIGSVVFAVINNLMIPLLKILFLPLNILTLGLFSIIINVLGLYLLTNFVPQFKLLPYLFPGWQYQGFVVPSVELTTFWVAVVASLLIGIFTHLLHWLMH